MLQCLFFLWEIDDLSIKTKRLGFKGPFIVNLWLALMGSSMFIQLPVSYVQYIVIIMQWLHGS